MPVSLPSKCTGYFQKYTRRLKICQGTSRIRRYDTSGLNGEYYLKRKSATRIQRKESCSKEQLTASWEGKETFQ